ncbi:MAG: helix-turn-helix transcriptional regulator [Verrucomicrobiota bacterium]
MQAQNSSYPIFFKTPCYTSRLMARRPNQKNDTPSEVGANIATARKRKGLTQRELADLMSVKQQSVADWERNIQSIGSNILKQLSDLLEVSADELLGIKKSPATEDKLTGKAWKTFSEVQKLPRKNREEVLNVVKGYISSKQP